MSKLGKKIIQRLSAFVEESEGARLVSVVPATGCFFETEQFDLHELKQLVQYMEDLEEQDALELLREQG